MEKFLEYRNYVFFTREQYVEQIRHKAPGSYVELKDTNLDNALKGLPSTYYLRVNSRNDEYIKECVEFAVKFHLSNVSKYHYNVTYYE